jgi:hypothetical protein
MPGFHQAGHGRRAIVLFRNLPFCEFTMAFHHQVCPRFPTASNSFANTRRCDYGSQARNQPRKQFAALFPPAYLRSRGMAIELDRHIGSPPVIDAIAGRMNARGISVFYGANSPRVALAEVRPPVGSQVAVGCFKIIRPIRLLDLTALSKVATHGSIFDVSLVDRLERTMFLRNLSRRIAVPVMPEHELFEYLPTQAIADFLATEAAPPLDGIIFPSVQIAGAALNVALFHKAARVEEIERPRGTEVRTSLGQMYEEGWEREYTVIEEVPPKKRASEKRDSGGVQYFSADFDARPYTLKIDLRSLRVHVVEAVSFKTKKHKVRRHRWEKSDPDF